MNRSIVALLLTLAVALSAACGDSGGNGDQPTGNTSVIFGAGEIPPGFPDDFPIPGNAVIGTTLIDFVNHRSEMSIQISADQTATAQFFNVGLVNQGYVVERSEDTGSTWTIEFSRNELEGTIVISTTGDVSQAVVQINQV